MNVLVVGSGGREHALAWKLRKSSGVSTVFCAPGNGGMEDAGTCVPVSPVDVSGLTALVRKENICLTVVGPEVPLAEGIVDAFEKEKLKIFGPGQKASRLESSKVYAKEFMAKHEIPTADFQIFDSAGQAIAFLEKKGIPVVVKADGLAAGKGVTVAHTTEEAVSAVRKIMEEKAFGEAGNRVVVEECLQGEEFSFMAITDGETVLPLTLARDYKRLLDGNKGPNTGGMGSFSPVPDISSEVEKLAFENALQKAVTGTVKDGIPYKGVLYAGLMLTKEGPKVLEYNCRFGDPETQVILPRLEADLLEVFTLAVEGNLHRAKVSWNPGACVCVALASAGYPEKYETGKRILGLERFQDSREVFVFHAGTKKAGNEIRTAGGRVLGVSALGSNFRIAVSKAYQAVKKISFDGMVYRKDIGGQFFTL